MSIRDRCLMVGAQDAPDSIAFDLERLVNRHIVQYNVAEFIVGNNGNFDRLAATAVEKARKKHPEVLLTILLPHPPTVKPCSLPAGATGTFFATDALSYSEDLAMDHAVDTAFLFAFYLLAYVPNAPRNAPKIVRTALDWAKKHELRKVSILR